jgi:type I site-specific restriction endonuclease
VDAKAQAEKRPFDHFVVPRFTDFLKVAAQYEDNYVGLLSDLSSDERRNRMLVNDIANAIDAGRNPIVLTERVEHVEVLAALLSGRFENVVTLIGGMSAVKKREINKRLHEFKENEKFVIVASGKYVGEGFDFPRLDTLFLALPVKSKTTITQYTGRLHRLVQGKSDVMVYDYVDVNIPMLERMYFTRIRHYKAVGYKTLVKEQDGTQINVIFDADEYMSPMLIDIEAAEKEVVIASPFLTGRNVTAVMPTLSGKMINDVIVTIVTKPIEEYAEKYRTAVAKNIERLSEAGVKIVTESELHQRFVVIDRRIVWYGSVNPLGYSGKDDNIMRLDGADVAVSLLKQRFGKAEQLVGENKSAEVKMGRWPAKGSATYDIDDL